jgi:hypothetical protein
MYYGCVNGKASQKHAAERIAVQAVRDDRGGESGTRPRNGLNRLDTADTLLDGMSLRPERTSGYNQKPVEAVSNDNQFNIH